MPGFLLFPVVVLVLFVFVALPLLFLVVIVFRVAEEQIASNELQAHLL